MHKNSREEFPTAIFILLVLDKLLCVAEKLF